MGGFQRSQGWAFRDATEESAWYGLENFVRTSIEILKREMYSHYAFRMMWEHARCLPQNGA
jgi:hypothetical protein